MTVTRSATTRVTVRPPDPLLAPLTAFQLAMLPLGVPLVESMSLAGRYIGLPDAELIAKLDEIVAQKRKEKGLK